MDRGTRQGRVHGVTKEWDNLATKQYGNMHSMTTFLCKKKKIKIYYVYVLKI